MGVIAASGAVWAAIPNGNELVRIDPATNRVVDTVKLPYPPCAFFALDGNTMWSSGGICADVVARIDLRTKRVTAKLAEAHPVGLGLAFGTLWVAAIGSRTVDQIDPHTGRLVARLPVSGTPVRLALGFGAVWVDSDGAVLRITRSN
jgi:sugar lactone lactonase YvrE